MLNSLSGISLFDGFDSRQLELLRPLFDYYSCPADTTIFKQGEKAVHLYLITAGYACIQYKPYDGPPIILAHLKPGDAFGWSAAVGNPLYSSGILSTSALEAIRIRGTDLACLCRKHPTTGSIILNRLALGVSGRWKDARIQVQTILKGGIHDAPGSQREG